MQVSLGLEEPVVIIGGGQIEEAVETASSVERGTEGGQATAGATTSLPLKGGTVAAKAEAPPGGTKGAR